MKRIYLFTIRTLAVALTATLLCGTVNAYVPYKSYGYGNDNKHFWMQAPYIPADPTPIIGNPLYIISDGKKVNVKGFDKPYHLFIDDKDYIYVVDFKENRAVKITDSGQLITEYGTSGDPKAKLNQPQGIYVDKNGDVYVCDTSNNRIAVFTNDGKFIREIVKPDDKRIANIQFMPIRVAIDSRGFYLVALMGVNQGIMMLSPSGAFEGFFGANKTEMSLNDRLKQLFYTQEQKMASQSLANSVSDLFIDKEGYIYTATRGANSEQIKKYNVGSTNLFKGKDMNVFPLPMRDSSYRTSFAGVTVDSMGNVYGLDTGTGRIFEYDSFGSPILSFGDKIFDLSVLKIGLFGDATSIAINSKGVIFVADNIYSAIQIFTPTDMAVKINQINDLYIDGDYKKAEEYSKEMLKINSFFDKAYMVIGKSYYQDQQWKTAMQYYKKAYDTTDYSDAFWEYRRIWIQNYLGYFILAAVVLFVAYLVWKRIRGSKARRDH